MQVFSENEELHIQEMQQVRFSEQQFIWILRQVGRGHRAAHRHSYGYGGFAWAKPYPLPQKRKGPRQVLYVMVLTDSGRANAAGSL